MINWGMPAVSQANTLRHVSHTHAQARPRLEHTSKSTDTLKESFENFQLNPRSFSIIQALSVISHHRHTLQSAVGSAAVGESVYIFIKISQKWRYFLVYF